MPYIVMVFKDPKNHTKKNLFGIYVYTNIKTLLEHSKGLLNYYDLRRKRNIKYITYKSYFNLKEISWDKYKFYNNLCKKVKS